MQSHSNLSLFTNEDQKRCEICGSTILRGRMSKSKWSIRRFCSRTCGGKWRARRHAENRSRIIENGEKECTKCKVSKPLTEFRRSYNHKDSTQAACIECQRKSRRDSYWENPEESRAYARVWAANNPDYKERKKATWARWYKRNRDAQLSRYRRYNAARRDSQREYDRKRRSSWSDEKRRQVYAQEAARTKKMKYWRNERQRASRRAYGREWRDMCRHKNTERQQRRRARLLRVQIATVDRRRVIDRWGMTCYICDRALDISEIALDHVYPISRGGGHCESNLRPICLPCNSSKGAKLPHEIEVDNPEMAERIRLQLSC